MEFLGDSQDSSKFHIFILFMDFIVFDRKKIQQKLLLILQNFTQFSNK